MRIRRDQVEAMRTPPWGPRRKLRDSLEAQGHAAALEAETGDLLLRVEGAGQTRIQFGDDGRVRTLEKSDGQVLAVETDEKGRVVGMADQEGGRSEFRYDATGRLSGITDPGGFRRDVVYRDDRPVEIHRYNRAPVGLDWDAAGRLEALRDGRGAALRFGYGKENQIARLTERGGAETAYRYSDSGRLEELRTARGAVWRFHEDAALGTGSVIRPDGTHVDRMPLGPALEQIVRADGSRVTISNDASGQPARVEYPDGVTVKLAWASEGRLADADDGRHRVRFEYDTAGRCTAEEVDGARLACRYDEHGALEGITLPSGEGLSFVSGPGGRVSELRDWDGNAYTFEWSPGGAVTGVHYPGPVREAMHPLPSGQLHFQEFWTRDSRIAREYSYDANDLVEQVEDSGRGIKRHQFDADDRLVSVSSPHGNLAYAYDPDGNMQLAGSRRFEYDALDRITGGTGIRCRCDALGNLVQWEDEKGLTLFRYNGQGQLTRADLPGERTVEYEYDALGRRLLKRIGGITTRFVWLGSQLLSEVTEGPRPSRTDYLYLPGTLRPLAMRRDGNLYFYQVDHLDTPIRLTDRNGEVVWEAEPIGTEVRVLSARVQQPLRFPGQYFDEETGLYYNVARYYQPATGRYTTPDPLFYDGQTNPYLYARNNPVTFIDPTGRFLPLLILGALALGAVIGAGFAAFHQLSTNAIHGDPWYKGLASAAAHGAIAGVAGAAGAIIGGVIGFAVGGPVGAVVGGLAGGFVGSALAGAGMAAYEAPEGEGWQACGNALVNSVPFVGSVRRFLDNPNDKDRGYQLAADIGFDVLGLALMALGARKGLAEIRTRTAAPVVDQKPPSPPVEEKPPTPPTEEPPVAPKEKPATLPEGNTPTEMGENIGRSVKGQSKGKTSSICKQVEELPLDQKGKTDALEAASKEAFGRTSGQATTAEGDMVVLPREVGTQRPVVGVEPDGTVFSGKADVAFDPTTGQMTATNITKNPPS